MFALSYSMKCMFVCFLQWLLIFKFHISVQTFLRNIFNTLRLKFLNFFLSVHNYWLNNRIIVWRRYDITIILHFLYRWHLQRVKCYFPSCRKLPLLMTFRTFLCVSKIFVRTRIMEITTAIALNINGIKVTGISSGSVQLLKVLIYLFEFSFETLKKKTFQFQISICLKITSLES